MDDEVGPGTSGPMQALCILCFPQVRDEGAVPWAVSRTGHSVVLHAQSVDRVIKDRLRFGYDAVTNRPSLPLGEIVGCLCLLVGRQLPCQQATQGGVRVPEAVLCARNCSIVFILRVGEGTPVCNGH